MLEQYSGPLSRFDCPKCGAKKEFTRYIDDEKNYYADHVGRCNRELNCGYHLTPSQYLKGNPNVKFIDFSKKNQVKNESNKIDLLPVDIMNESVKQWRSNNFTKYLSTLVGWDVVERISNKYIIGSSKHWEGATVFWQVDTLGRPRQAKIMHYNAYTGRRTRSVEEALKWNNSSGRYFSDQNGFDKIAFAGKFILKNNDVNFKQCFYGEHLLLQDLFQPVGIVESEKTAIIASLYIPNVIWLSTGGKNGCKWTTKEVCKVLQGRSVTLFPDLGCYQDWYNKMKVIQSLIDCEIKTSNFLEMNSTKEEKRKGYDLADLLLKIDVSTGLAITESNYPLMWDLLV